jgi:hypothetical protein
MRVQLKKRIDWPIHNKQIYTDETALNKCTSREQGCARMA